MKVTYVQRCSIDPEHWVAEVEVSKNQSLWDVLCGKPASVETRQIRSCRFGVYWFWLPEMKKLGYDDAEWYLMNQAKDRIKEIEEREKLARATKKEIAPSNLPNMASKKTS